MTGLSKAEVQERLARGQDNFRVDPSTRTVKQIVKDNVFTYFNLIFTVLAVLLVIVGSFKELTFMLIVLANTGIGIFQEIRSKRTLDKLKLLKMPKAHAIRDGRETEVPVEKLVLDDVIILRAGSQIPADARVLEGSVQVNEALLTGEADEIAKAPGDRLLSGSFVVSGEAAAVLTAVGADSYISRLTKEATKERHREDSEMIASLDKLVKFVGIIIIPVGGLMVFQQAVTMKEPFSDSVIAMVAAVLGMIPEGLYMTASVAMVVSTIRLARKDVLVQNLRCIETLARVDVLLVDKTGTITSPDMKVEGVAWACRESEKERAMRLVGDFAAAQNKDNATMAALQERFTERGGRMALNVCPFSSRYKYSGVTFDDGYFVMGAPEYILREKYDRYEDRIRMLTERGYRVLAFAQTEEEPTGRQLTAPASLIALIYLANPVRENARETFKYFADNGVKVKVISGDDPVTVSNVATEAGIPGADHYLDARSLVNQKAVYDAVQRFTVFGRVSPDQKRMFVKALQEQGKTVGMTGDGVNDILALRDADCSVAMASGSEAASNSAQLVLMDSDFSKMPQIVAEGRRVVNNLQKAASLYLTKNLFSFLLAIFALISVLTYPLKPSQITLISMFTIGVPSFVLSLEPNSRRIKGHFIANVLKMALPAGLTMFISVSALVLFGKVFEINETCISTSSTMLVALVGFLFLGKVATPPNKLHMGMLSVLIAGMAACIIFMPGLFGIESITMEASMLLGVFLIATEGLFRYVHKIIGKIVYAGDQRRDRKEQKASERRARRRGETSGDQKERQEKQ